MTVNVRLRCADGTEILRTVPDYFVAQPPPPPAPLFPNETNTGPVGPLTVWTGETEFRTNGQVIENREIRLTDAVYVPASNVVFRNCLFKWTGTQRDSTWTTLVNEGDNNLFDHCEFDGKDMIARAIWGDGNNLTVRACHIHNTGNAVETGTPLTVEECYFHDIWEPPGTDWHADGIQPNPNNIIIVHNTILMRNPSTAAIQMPGQTMTNVLIKDNLLAGGGYTMYTGTGSGVQVLNNRFSTELSKDSAGNFTHLSKVGIFGIWYRGGAVRSGNVIHETGASCDTGYG